MDRQLGAEVTVLWWRDHGVEGDEHDVRKQVWGLHSRLAIAEGELESADHGQVCVGTAVECRASERVCELLL